MQFNCKVDAMQFDETRDLWQLRIGDGRTLDLPLRGAWNRIVIGADNAARRRHRRLQGPLVPYLLLGRTNRRSPGKKSP